MLLDIVAVTSSGGDSTSNGNDINGTVGIALLVLAGPPPHRRRCSVHTTYFGDK